MPAQKQPPRPGQWPSLPRPWAQQMLNVGMRETTRDILSQIRAEIPEYRRSTDGPLTRQTRQAVERALHTCFVQIFEQGSPSPQHDQMFRNLGRTEAQAGRSLERLQSAYRIGSLTAWRHVMAMNERMPLPAETIAQLASAVFTYVDHLAVLSAEGFNQAMLGHADHVNRLRARLLQMVLDQPATPMDAIRELATQIGWELPEQVVVVDLRDAQALPRGVCVVLGSEVLVGVESPIPTALLPAPLTEELLTELRQVDDPVRVSIGCPVPLEHARQSLQWAQLASTLRGAGVLPDVPLTICEDVLPTLLLAANPLVVDALVTRRLGPLLSLSAAKRVKFGRLLSTWLERGGSQAEIADQLGLHRQTVHYQFTRLHEMFGDDLREADARVEILLALRSVLPEWDRTSASVTAA